jgi:thiol-disulfide isomerase/thioredoxin
MKILILALIFTTTIFAETHNNKSPHKTRAIQGFDPFFVPGTSDPLTAQEAESGKWAPDEEGGCDLEKGCAYKNKETGEVRYLPDAEKKKLKAKKEEPSKAGSSGKIMELNDKESWDEKFETEKGKKALVLIFSAEDCAPCKALKAKLEKQAPEGAAIFTAIRPTYRSVQGHKLHEAFRSSIGGSVPVAFIYTPDEKGKWKGQILKGNKIHPAVEAIK